MLAAFLAYADFHRPLQGLSVVAGGVSVVPLLILAFAVGGCNLGLATVAKVDVVTAVLLAAGAVVHVRVLGGE